MLYDHLVHRAAAAPRARRRGEDRRRHRRAAAARAGSDLLSAGGEGARRQDRRAAEVGRPVRVRQRRRRSAVPARAGRALRSGARHSGRHRASPSYAGVPITYPGGGDTLTFVRGHEDEGKTRASVDWTSLARLDGTIVCYAGPQQLPHMLDALLAHGRPPDDAAALVYDGTLPTQQTIAGTLARSRDASKESDRSAAGDPRRRPRRRAARAPALVRRAAAVRQARAGHAAARAGGGVRRSCSKRWAPRRSRRR